MYPRRSEYNAKWSDLKEFTVVHSVPKQLKQKMQDYFQTVWSLNHGIDPMQVRTYFYMFVLLIETEIPKRQCCY